MSEKQEIAYKSYIKCKQYYKLLHFTITDCQANRGAQEQIFKGIIIHLHACHYENL